MPQMNKGGKFIFGKSLIRNDLTIHYQLRQAIVCVRRGIPVRVCDRISLSGDIIHIVEGLIPPLSGNYNIFCRNILLTNFNVMVYNLKGVILMIYVAN